MWITCLIVMVHFDGTSDTQFQTSLFRQRIFRRHSDGHHDGLRFDGTTGSQCHFVRTNRLDAVFQNQIYAIFHDFAIDDLDHIIIQWRHDLVLRFDQGNIVARHFQVLSDFKTDIAAAHDRHIFDFVSLGIGRKSSYIRHRLHDEYMLGIDPCDGTRTNGIRTRRQEQDIVRLFIRFACLHILYGHCFFFFVDCHDFIVDTCIDVVLLIEFRRCHQHQTFRFLDIPTDVERNATVRERNVRPSFEHHDLS